MIFNLFNKHVNPSLEEQLKALAAIGFELEQGVTIDDMLYSFPRADYEKKPYELTLNVFGFEVEKEPWGRPFCRRVWNFDFECIEGHGSYVEIVKNLCRFAQMSERVSSVSDHIDIEGNNAWLKYTLDQIPRFYEITINNDWADDEVIQNICHDMEGDGKRFYFLDNGQAVVLFYLEHKTAKALTKLSQCALKPFT